VLVGGFYSARTMEQGKPDAVSENTVTAAPRPQRRWLAALLSLVTPGLGQWYCDRLRRGLTLQFAHQALHVVWFAMVVTLPHPALNVALPLMSLLAWHVFSSFDAARCAREVPLDRPRRRWSRWYGCLTFFAVASFVVAPLWAVFGLRPWIAAYKLPTGSMEPTVLRGDHFLATNWSYNVRDPFTHRLLWHRRGPLRGDLVTFPFPEEPSRMFMKRVIGLPGETVEVRGRTVYIDGAALVEPYVQFMLPEEVDRLDWGPEVVPPGQLFVLGDNRDNSRDSRFWGFLRQDDLLGRVVMVYWSFDSTSGQVRFDRIGHRLH
jgi:signal peptidase I